MKQLLSLNFIKTIIPVIVFFMFQTTGANYHTSFEELEKNSREKLRVVIADFKTSSPGSDYAYLTRKLPFMLSIGLIKNRMIEVVDKSELLKTVYQTIGFDTNLPPDEFILEDKFLDQSKIDIIVQGSFTEYKGKIRFKAGITDRRSKQTFDIRSKVVDIRGIYSGIEELAEEINAEISALAVRTSEKRLAVICFSDKSINPYQKDSGNLGRNLTISLISNLYLKDQISIIPWSKTSFYCSKDSVNPSDIISETDADALLSGKYFIDGNLIKVVPELYIKDRRLIFISHEESIKLTEVSGNLDNYYNLVENLRTDVNNVLNAIVDDNGDWNVDPLNFTSDISNDFIVKGEEYLKENTYLAALMFIKAIQEDQLNKEAHYQLGRVRVMQERFEEAIAEFQTILMLDSICGRAYEGLGEVYYEMGEYHKSVNFYEKALKLEPENLDIYLNLAVTHYMLRDYDQALGDVQVVLDADTKNSDAYYMMGRIYAAIGDFDSEKNAYLKVLELDPGNNEVQIFLGTIFFEESIAAMGQEHYEDAIEKLNKAIIYKPQSALYHDWRGVCQFKSGRNDLALSDFKTAIKLDSNYISAYTNLSEFYIIKGMTKEALNLANIGLKFVEDPADKTILLFLNCISSKLLNYKTTDCIGEIEKLLESRFNLDIWSFAEMEEWLASGSLDIESKNFIVGLIEQLKSKQGNPDVIQNYIK